MSTLRERVKKHLEENEKPNFLWYTLLVQSTAMADPEDKRGALKLIREKMEDTYNLPYADDAWWLMYGVSKGDEAPPVEGGNESPKRKRNEATGPFRQSEPEKEKPQPKPRGCVVLAADSKFGKPL